ncbi:glycosyltransferase [bacterium]|nr:glycosyltransferase [bacterium]
MSRRLLYVITQTEFGGAQRYVLDLARAAQRAGYEVAVATGHDGDGAFDLRLEQAAVSHFKLQHLTRDISPLNDGRALLELRGLFAKLQPDLVHLNSTKAGVLGSLACGHHIRSVYTAHGWVFNEQLSAFKRFLYVTAERASAQRLNRIIVLSRYDWERGAAEGIPRNKMLVIQNGIEKQFYIPAETARRELSLFAGGIGAEDRVILCIANFYATKGLVHLIAAMPQVSERGKLVILGDGELRSELEAAVRSRNLEGRVFLPGRLEDASRFIKGADVFVLPSVKEGLPYVILEALQAEVPIVATTVGALPEILDHELVPPGNVQALSAAIDRQLASPRISKVTAPSVERMEQQTLGLYEEILGPQGG